MTTSVLSKKIAAERVSEGAKFLDKTLSGWYNKIDLSTLNMGSECKCVLGQLGGNPVNLDRISWDEASWRLKENHDKGISLVYSDMTGLFNLDDPEALGFNDDSAYVEGRDGSEYINISYADLLKAWTREIKQRRGEE